MTGITYTLGCFLKEKRGDFAILVFQDFVVELFELLEKHLLDVTALHVLCASRFRYSIRAFGGVMQNG